MSRPRTLRRVAAVGLVLSTTLAACATDPLPTPSPAVSDAASSLPAPSSRPVDGDDTPAPPAVGVGVRVDGVLRIGTVLPLTGPLRLIAAPQSAAVQLAVDDVNAAGGALGAPVELLVGDSETDAATARAVVAAHVEAGADVIVGAVSSTVTAGMLLAVSDAPAAQCSASASAAGLAAGAEATRFVRTAAPDAVTGAAIGRVLARLAPTEEAGPDGAVVRSAPTVAVVTSDAPGAVAMAAALDEVLASLPAAFGATVVARETVRADGAGGHAAQAAAVAALDPPPAAVVVLGYREVADVVAALLDRGVDAASLVLPAAAFRAAFADEVGQPLDGARVVGPGGDETFSARLEAAVSAVGEPGNLLYGAQAYDCVVTLALAAVAAGSDATADIVANVARVTSGGTRCTTYAACVALLADGVNIDYDGPAGALALDAVGDPTVGRYALASFVSGGLEVVGVVDVDLRGVGG